MKRTIKVTEANIRLGRKRWMNGLFCPVYRALHRTFKSRVSYCGFSYFTLDGVHVPLPRAATAMQRRILHNPRAAIAPFSFTVTV